MYKWFSKCLGIATILVMLAALSACGEAPANGSGGTLPPSSATDAVETLPEETATDTPEPTSTIEPIDTATDAPEDTADPEDTSSAAPTDAETDTATEADASPTPSPTSQSEEDTGALEIPPVVGTAKVENSLTLRSTASSSASSLAQIPKDAEFTVVRVESNKKWLKVKYDDKQGYVPFKYVSLGDDEDALVCTVVSNSALNVRGGAGTGADVIGSAKSGTNFVMLSKTTVSGQTWYEVQIGDKTGYVSAKYCRISEK
jgi:hypothetical protein